MVGSLLRDYLCAVLYYAIHLLCMTSLVRPQEVDHLFCLYAIQLHDFGFIRPVSILE
jgi:hypothetical protein